MPRDKANTSAGVRFTLGAAREIAETVRIVRGGDRKQRGLGGRNAPYASSHYLSKVTDEWKKDTKKTLTIYVGTPGSEAASTGDTVEAWNKVGDVAKDEWVLLARANGSFYLVGGAGGSVKRGTFTGTWGKGSTVTVTDAATSGVTYSAKNYLTPVSGSGSHDCEIAYIGSEWVLVAFDLTQLEGYSQGKSQALVTVSGSLKWLEIVEQNVITSVSMGSSGLTFVRETVYTLGVKTPKPSDITIPITDCTT
jgi:hypothetical protein